MFFCSKKGPKGQKKAEKYSAIAEATSATATALAIAATTTTAYC